MPATTVLQGLASELLINVKNSNPTFFERLVVELLVAMGYGGSIQEAGQAVGRTGDEGIDGIIKEDILGLDLIYIQAKKWNGIIGRPEIQVRWSTTRATCQKRDFYYDRKFQQ